MRLLPLLLLSLIPAAHAESKAAAALRILIDQQRYSDALAQAAQALQAEPMDPHLLGIYGVAAAQTGNEAKAFEVWVNALRNGADIRVRAHRLQNIRTGMNIFSNFAKAYGSDNAAGELVIRATSVEFIGSRPGQSFQLTISESKVSVTPSPMAAKDTRIDGYDGRQFGEGSLFFSGKVNGQKVEIPVTVEGSSRRILSGHDLNSAPSKPGIVPERMKWRVEGTGRLLLATVLTLRKAQTGADQAVK